MRFHKPLYAHKNPRLLSGGRSPYVFRREAGAETGFGGAHHRFPTLYVTEKIKDKAGLAFFGCPHFNKLRDCDVQSAGGLGDDEMKDLSSKGHLRIKTLEKKSELIDKKKKKLKHKRQGKKNDPKIKAVRKHLEKIIKYHEHKVNEEIPSIYPLLGPANTDSENDSDTMDQKRDRTKKELKIYDPNKV